MRPLQCLCARRCLTAFRCRYEIIAVGGGETSHKRPRGKAWGARREERRDDAVIREKATRRPSDSHRRHVHDTPSYRLIWGQKASILLPLHSTRLWHTFTSHVLFNTNGDGARYECMCLNTCLSLIALFFLNKKQTKTQHKLMSAPDCGQTVRLRWSRPVAELLLYFSFKINHLRRQPAEPRARLLLLLSSP